MTVGHTPPHSVSSDPLSRGQDHVMTFLMPTQVGISWNEALSVMRHFLTAQKLCSRVLWEEVLGGRFISLIWDRNFFGKG